MVALLAIVFVLIITNPPSQLLGRDNENITVTKTIPWSEMHVYGESILIFLALFSLLSFLIGLLTSIIQESEGKRKPSFIFYLISAISIIVLAYLVRPYYGKDLAYTLLGTGFLAYSVGLLFAPRARTETDIRAYVMMIIALLALDTVIIGFFILGSLTAVIAVILVNLALILMIFAAWVYIVNLLKRHKNRERSYITYISPSYTPADFHTPLTFDDKIKIFKDRTFGWQLDIADQCINGKRVWGIPVREPIPHSGFAVLDIVLSYFEMISKFNEGYCRTDKSKIHFKNGVHLVFPNLRSRPTRLVDDALNALYGGARCGLYHDSITDPRIVLTGQLTVPLYFEPRISKLIINPHLLVPALKSHLKNYCNQLLDNRNIRLRQNFERRFDYLNTR
jgi:hypothetical protein